MEVCSHRHLFMMANYLSRYYSFCFYASEYRKIGAPQILEPSTDRWAASSNHFIGPVQKISELLDSIESVQYILHYCLEFEELREIIWKARRETDRKTLLGVAERARQAAQFLINNTRILWKFSHANLLLTEEYLADVDIGETEAYREVLVLYHSGIQWTWGPPR